MIQEFYAVTRTSVYHVQSDENGANKSAKKIAVQGSSAIPIGDDLVKDDLQLISVGKHLMVFLPTKQGLVSPTTGIERDPVKVNTDFHGGHSSAVVALFDDRETAVECMGKDNLQPCDPRWLGPTKHILEEIGDEHPAFVVSSYPGFGLLIPEPSDA